jgi:hypothetical protein
METVPDVFAYGSVRWLLYHCQGYNTISNRQTNGRRLHDHRISSESHTRSPEQEIDNYFDPKITKPRGSPILCQSLYSSLLFMAMASTYAISPRKNCELDSDSIGSRKHRIRL